jgi:hypothetical protein
MSESGSFASFPRCPSSSANAPRPATKRTSREVAFVPIEDEPHANGRPPDWAASTNLGCLVFGFDGILPDDLAGLIAQRIEILEGLRIAVCNRLVEAIELSDAHMFGRITYECNYLSVGGTQIATASLLLRCP